MGPEVKTAEGPREHGCMLMGIVSQEEETDAADDSRENRIIPAMSRIRWDPGGNRLPAVEGLPLPQQG